MKYDLIKWVFKKFSTTKNTKQIVPNISDTDSNYQERVQAQSGQIVLIPRGWLCKKEKYCISVWDVHSVITEWRRAENFTSNIFLYEIFWQLNLQQNNDVLAPSW